MRFFDDIKDAQTGSDDAKDISELLELEEDEIEASYDQKPPNPMIAISQMINSADNRADSFDVLAVVSEKYFETDRLMPKVLAQWAAAMMRGEKKRPKRNGKFANGTLERNTYIWPVTRKLVESGMMATRNDESPPTSACDAVAEALKQLGENPTAYASVKRIWNDYQRWHGPLSQLLPV